MQLLLFDRLLLNVASLSFIAYLYLWSPGHTIHPCQSNSAYDSVCVTRITKLQRELRKKEKGVLLL